MPEIVIHRRNPWLSWESGNQQANTFFHILVASSPYMLRNNQGDCWDKNQVATNQIRYAGKPLQAGKTYYWKIQAVSRQGASQYSVVMSFHIDAKLSDTIAYYPLYTKPELPVKFVQTAPGKVFADFGREAFSQILLHINSTRNDSITVEAGEMAHGNAIDTNPGRNIRYIKRKMAVKPGLHDYTLTWPVDEKRNTRNPIQMPKEIGEVYPFRYVTVTSNDTLDHGAVERHIVHYPFNDSAASFVSSDSVLNQVWELCKYSMKATSFAGFYVDGDRERIPYEADALINQLSHYAVDAEYSIARRTLAYLIYHPTWPTEWSLQDLLIAWNDYLYTADPSFLEKYYPELQKKMLMPLAGANGLISTKTGKQTDAFLQSVHRKDFDNRHTFVDIVDWPQTGTADSEKENPGETDGFVFNQYNAVVNAFYYRNLVLMEKIAGILHKPQDAKMYRQHAEQVQQSYHQVFTNAQGLIKDGDSTQHTSLHANMFAMAFGLVPGKDMRVVTDFIKTRKMACSVYGAQFLMEALYNAGAGDYAKELLSATTKRSWYNMIRNNATITLEAWDKIYKPNLDMNHAWGAVPANIIVRKLMGVEPVEPGFKKISIRPQPGDLPYAALVTPTIRGAIKISFQKAGNNVKYSISIPGGSTADLYLPAPANSHLYQDAKALTVKPENNLFSLRDLPAGEYKFMIR